MFRCALISSGHILIFSPTAIFSPQTVYAHVGHWAKNNTTSTLVKVGQRGRREGGSGSIHYLNGQSPLGGGGKRTGGGREKGIYSRCFFPLSLLGGREMRESAVCRFFPVYASGVDVPPLAI